MILRRIALLIALALPSSLAFGTYLSEIETQAAVKLTAPQTPPPEGGGGGGAKSTPRNSNFNNGSYLGSLNTLGKQHEQQQQRQYEQQQYEQQQQQQQQQQQHPFDDHRGHREGPLHEAAYLSERVTQAAADFEQEAYAFANSDAYNSDRQRHVEGLFGRPPSADVPEWVSRSAMPSQSNEQHNDDSGARNEPYTTSFGRSPAASTGDYLSAISKAHTTGDSASNSNASSEPKSYRQVASTGFSSFLDGLSSKRTSNTPYGSSESMASSAVDTETSYMRNMEQVQMQHMRMEEEQMQRMQREQEQMQQRLREQEQMQERLREQEHRQHVLREQEHREQMLREQEQMQRLQREQEQTQQRLREQEQMQHLQREQEQVQQMRMTQEHRQHMLREQEQMHRLQREREQKQIQESASPPPGDYLSALSRSSSSEGASKRPPVSSSFQPVSKPVLSTGLNSYLGGLSSSPQNTTAFTDSSSSPVARETRPPSMSTEKRTVQSAKTTKTANTASDSTEEYFKAQSFMSPFGEKSSDTQSASTASSEASETRLSSETAEESSPWWPVEKKKTFQPTTKRAFVATRDAKAKSKASSATPLSTWVNPGKDIIRSGGTSFAASTKPTPFVPTRPAALKSDWSTKDYTVTSNPLSSASFTNAEPTGPSIQLSATTTAAAAATSAGGGTDVDGVVPFPQLIPLQKKTEPAVKTMVKEPAIQIKHSFPAPYVEPITETKTEIAMPHPVTSTASSVHVNTETKVVTGLFTEERTAFSRHVSSVSPDGNVEVSLDLKDSFAPNQVMVQTQAQPVSAPEIDTKLAQHISQKETLQLKGSERRKPSTVISELTTAAPVSGGSLKTWSFKNPDIKKIHVVLKSEGRPVNADIALWQGPDHSPYKVKVYVENGLKRPFSAVFEANHLSNTVSVRNIGSLEFPMSAHVVPEDDKTASIMPPPPSSTMKADPSTIHGGALKTFTFDAHIDSVQVLLQSDGLPLNATVELFQGPGSSKQSLQIFSENGSDKPFFMVVETPGNGNVVRIRNASPIEFPMTVSVEPYRVARPLSPTEPIISGDVKPDEDEANQGVVRKVLNYGMRRFRF